MGKNGWREKHLASSDANRGFVHTRESCCMRSYFCLNMVAYTAMCTPAMSAA